MGDYGKIDFACLQVVYWRPAGGDLKEEEFLNGLALAQFLPGATLVTLTVFIGYRLRHLAGAAASFIGFCCLPSG
ncbi:chromate transporter [Moorella naiadis]